MSSEATAHTSHLETLTALFHVLRAGLVVADEQGRVSLVNRHAAELLGTTPESLQGRDLAAALGGEEELTSMLATLPIGAERRTSLALRRADGSVIDIGATLSRNGPELPSNVSFVLVFRELAGLRRAELELRQVEQHRALGRLLAGFAHELRNPLAAVRALAEGLLAELAEGDGRREYAHRLVPLVERIEKIIRAAMDVGAPRLPARRACDAAGIARRAIARVAAERQVPPAELTVGSSSPKVYVDADQLADALAALLDNAHHAAGDSGVRVELSAAGPDPLLGGESSVVLRVIDRGAGMTKAQQDRLFEPFFSTKPSHSGLGLAVAQGLVRSNGGRIAVDLAGEQTTFAIVLAGLGASERVDGAA